MLRSKPTEDGVWRAYQIDVSTGLSIPPCRLRSVGQPADRRRLEPKGLCGQNLMWRLNHVAMSTCISNPSFSGGYESIGTKGDALVERKSVYNLKRHCVRGLEDALRYGNAEKFMYMYPRRTKKVNGLSSLNVDAVEFVPGSPDKSSCKEDKVRSRVCARCDETFFVTADVDAYETHYCRRLDKEMRYECFNGFYDSLGCNSTRYHVRTWTTPGVNSPLDGYVQTAKSRGGGYESIGAKGDARVNRNYVYNFKRDGGKGLEDTLRPYVLSPERLKILGYPIRYGNGETFVYMHPKPTKNVNGHSSLNVDAVEFVPGSSSRSYETDNGKSSGEEDEVVSRVCARCDETFFVTVDGDAYGAHYCRHHSGRLDKDMRYECCDGYYDSLGCNSTRHHVWTGTTPGLNGPLDGYVRTTKCRGGVYGLDTEMCYTTAGLELGQVAIVSWDGALVYSAVVKPTSPVVDYNTRFSGLRRRDIARATKTLREVQDDILKFVGCDTILVGHALDNDLRALKLVHGAVVDTCDLYPHQLGFPFRRSLRELTMEKFGREIQNCKAGHSPTEDAVAAMDLGLLRIRNT